MIKNFLIVIEGLSAYKQLLFIHTGKVITVESLHKRCIVILYIQRIMLPEIALYYAHYMYYYNTGVVQLTFEIRI